VANALGAIAGAMAAGELTPDEAAADRAREEAEKSGAKRPFSPPDLAPAGRAGARPLFPVVVNGFPGLSGLTERGTPPDTTGTIGLTRYIQLVNSRAEIFNRFAGSFIGGGTLNSLAAIPIAPNVLSADPQVIWDTQTNRFYYTALFEFPAFDHKLGIGFSKTSSPNNVTTDWCHYTLGFPAQRPDFPKLGHSGYFLIIGANIFDSRRVFLGSRLVAISKPPAGTGCPALSTFRIGATRALVDSTNHRVWTPVPANQVRDRHRRFRGGPQRNHAVGQTLVFQRDAGPCDRPPGFRARQGRHRPFL
jgi:hypothetical protein